MRTNIRSTERTLRVLAAAAVGILVLTNMLTGSLAVILGGAAILLLATGSLGYCPAYALRKDREVKR